LILHEVVVPTGEIGPVYDEQITNDNGVVQDDEELVTHPDRVDGAILLCPAVQDTFRVLWKERKAQWRTRRDGMPILIFEILTKTKGKYVTEQ
jgi:hypothetical protein